jgi:NRPS condensation-like uncharacterized protein
LDQERLKKAIRIIIDVEPVLGCKFVNHWMRPYWERFTDQELNKFELLKVKEADRTSCETLMQDFLSDEFDWETVPQISAFLISMEKYERLILKINHSVCDAGGFKTLLNLLASTYRRLAKEPDHVPFPNQGSRSMWQVYKRFSFMNLLSIIHSGFTQFWRVTSPSKNFQYPSGYEKKGALHYVFKHFSREKVRLIIEYGNKHNATINDLFITALIRAMVKQIGWNDKKRFTLAGTVDLRRYLPGRQAEALCQVSGIYFVKFLTEIGKDFSESLLLVKKDIDYNKNNNFGLGIIFVAGMIWSPYPYAFTKLVNRWIWLREYRKGTVGPGFTNLGPIDNQFHDFGDSKIVSAFMTTPGTQPPFFFMGMSGYSGTLTLSSGIYESAIPRGAVEELFDLMEAELPI